MNRKQLIAIAVLAAGMASSASANTISFTVDCASGQSIGAVIARSDARKPMLVIVRGTCEESVTINREDVTLRGDPRVGGTLVGTPGVDTILITASRVNIEDLTVVGGNIGIRLQGPFYAGVRDSTVTMTTGPGILVRAGDIAIIGTTVDGAGSSGLALHRGASARISNSHFSNSHFAGIYAEANSTVNAGGGSMTGNGGPGAQLEGSSHGTFSGIDIRDNEIGILVSESQARIDGNTISGNRQHGVLAQAGAKVGLNANTITLNQQDGVVGYLGPTLVLHGNEITDNTGTGVACDLNCTLQIGGARITRNAVHGILVMRDSLLMLNEPTTDAGGNYGWVDLWCGDKETSVDGLANFIGSVSDTCTGFDD
jgi:hypothetical protein